MVQSRRLPLIHEHLSRNFRVGLAYQFQEEIKKVTRRTDGDYWHTDTTHVGIMLRRYKMEVLNKFPHEIPDPTPEGDYDFIASLLENGQYHEILDICDWFIRNASHLDLTDGIETDFNNNPSAYEIGYDGYVPFIYPVNQGSAKSTAGAIESLNSNKQIGVLTHLHTAATRFHNQD